MRIRYGVAGVLTAALITAWPAGLVAQGVIAGDPAKGAALLAEARKAIGGEDKIAAVKTIEAKGAFRRTQGNNQVQGDLELLVELPDKMKRTEDTSAPGGGPMTLDIQALNGTVVWDENTGALAGVRGGLGGGGGGRGGGGGGGRGGGGFGGGDRGFGGQPTDGGQPGAPPAIDPEVIRQAQLRQRQGDLSRLLLVWLLKSNDPVVWIGTAEAPDGKADVVEFRPAGEGAVATRLFLDAGSHLPLMITWQGGAAGGGRGGRRDGGAAQPATLRMTLGDYKAVNGVRLPHTVIRATNGQTTEEWTFGRYRINESFKANTFEQKK